MRSLGHKSVPGCGPTSGFYEPQVVRLKLEQEVHGCGPTDKVPTICSEWETPSVVRPVMDHDQRYNVYGNAVGANSNGISAKSDVSVMQYPAGGEGQTILLPVPGQTQSSTQGDRRQVEGKSMSVATEQPATVPLYRLVQVTPGGDTTQLCSGIPQVSTSRKQTEERRHCSNFSSEERTPDVQALYESFDSAYTSADFETSRCPKKLSTNTEVQTTQKTREKRITTSESEDGDVSAVRRYRTRKTETNAKVSKTTFVPPF